MLFRGFFIDKFDYKPCLQYSIFSIAADIFLHFSSVLLQFSHFRVNVSCRAGLHLQQLCDWPRTALVKIQSGEQLYIPDT